MRCRFKLTCEGLFCLQRQCCKLSLGMCHKVRLTPLGYLWLVQLRERKASGPKLKWTLHLAADVASSPPPTSFHLCTCLQMCILIMYALTFLLLHLHDLFLPLIEGGDVFFAGHWGISLPGSTGIPCLKRTDRCITLGLIVTIKLHLCIHHLIS